MRQSRTERGRLGESLVASWLERRGYEIVDRNVRVGRLEIDLVARLGNTLAFVEVRGRAEGGLLHPAETVDAKKRARIRQAALRWLREQEASGARARFDVAAVTFRDAGRQPRIDYYTGAF